MRRKKLNRLEAQIANKEKIERGLAGTGRYLFKNKTRGEIFLPKPGLDGKKRLQLNETFIGDNYFFRMVPTDLIIVENLEIPQKESTVADKPRVLLTEQPPVYTNKGHVEYVQEDPAKKLVVEQPKKAEGKLFVEPANDSVVVIR